ncbi:MAG: C10 family peptidase [Candidatus Latescibacteria bacterium]|nr:C10 family peptidase [Candidatus Latescibacterota bacterium]
MADKAAESFFSSLPSAVIKKPVSGMSRSHVKQLVGETGETVAYVAELEPEGFIILSGDTGIEPVIGYSLYGTFPFENSQDNVLLHLIQWDMESRKQGLLVQDSELFKNSERNNLLWNFYISDNVTSKSTATSQEVWGPLLKTTWHQLTPYNAFCPLDPDTGKRSYVGCVATAMAQIFYYWKFPSTIYFTDEDSYISNESVENASTIFIPEESDVYDFPSFDILNSKLTNIVYNGDDTEKAYLCFATGIKFKMNYSSVSSSASVGTEYLNKLGYNNVIAWYDWKESYNAVIENIKTGWPVNLSIYKSQDNSASEGHSVVLDGYDESLDQFHINMGWGGSGDVWYSLPNISDYNIISEIIYNIAPTVSTIKGRITDMGTGYPVVSAIVSVYPGHQRAITNKKGDYILEIPGNSHYTLTVTRANYNSYIQTDISAGIDQEILINASLEPSGSSTVAYYRFEGNGLDESGNGFQATINTERVNWTAGIYGQAALLSSDSNGYAMKAPGYGLFYPGEGDWTVEMMVKIPDGYYAVIYSESYYMGIDSGQVYFGIKSNISSPFHSVGSHLPLDIGEWVHIAGVYHYKEKLQLYINGQLMSEDISEDVPGISPWDYIFLGDLSNSTKSGLIIDEIRISSAALDPGEFIGAKNISGAVIDTITKLPVSSSIVTVSPGNFRTLTGEDGTFSFTLAGSYNFSVAVNRANYSSESRLVQFNDTETNKKVYFYLQSSNTPTLAHYHFDGNTKDTSGNAFDLIQIAQKTSWTDGNFGQAAVVGVEKDGYAFRAPGYGLYYPGNGDWTLEIIVKVPKKYYAVIWSDSYFLGLDSYWAYFGINNNSTGYTGNIFAPLFVSAGRWIHVAGVYKDKQSLQLYINGELISELPAKGTPQTIPWDDIFVGGWIPDQTRNGLVIDELRISSSALKPEQFMEWPFFSAPADVALTDVPGDNGHSLKITWSSTPFDEMITQYNIYRSRNSKLTSPLYIDSFDTFEELMNVEKRWTIFIDSVPGDQYSFIDPAVPVAGTAYYYWVESVSDVGTSEKVPAKPVLTTVESTPSEFNVHAPYPNPFNPTTTFSYEIPEDCTVEFTIYDILGRQIAILENGLQSAGIHSAIWDGRDQNGNLLGSGIYLYKVNAGLFTSQGKVVFLR